jgi:hypothetical protein
MFQWLLWQIINFAKSTQERSELGQTEATVPEACPPPDEALHTPVHDEEARPDPRPVLAS